MRHVVLPVLQHQEAVNYALEEKQEQQPLKLKASGSPRSALGWPVFDREGKLAAVAVAVNHVPREEEDEAADGREDDDEGRRDHAAALAKLGHHFAFGPEEERAMVNLCAQVGGEKGRPSGAGGASFLFVCYVCWQGA